MKTIYLISTAILLTYCSSETNEKTVQEIIEIATASAPANISSEATVLAADGSVLREGSNDWTCMPGTPPNENVNPMCVDQAWQQWLQAYINQEPYDSEAKGFGVSYMLQGDQAVDNNDPFNTDQSVGTWVQEGPHLMLLMPASLMSDLPRDPYAGGPYVMWENNEFVHMMVPLEVTERPN